MFEQKRIVCWKDDSDWHRNDRYIWQAARTNLYICAKIYYNAFLNDVYKLGIVSHENVLVSNMASFTLRYS